MEGQGRILRGGGSKAGFCFDAILKGRVSQSCQVKSFLWGVPCAQQDA